MHKPPRRSGIGKHPALPSPRGARDGHELAPGSSDRRLSAFRTPGFGPDGKKIEGSGRWYDDPVASHMTSRTAVTRGSGREGDSEKGNATADDRKNDAITTSKFGPLLDSDRPDSWAGDAATDPT